MNKVEFSTRIGVETHSKLKVWCVKNGFKVGDAVEMALQDVSDKNVNLLHKVGKCKPFFTRINRVTKQDLKMLSIKSEKPIYFILDMLVNDFMNNYGK